MTERVFARRYHDFSCGHRVVGHEGKCALLHGHNYRVWFTIEADKLDSVSRVLDFSVIKELFCEWLEENWDHKFLASKEDPILRSLLGDVSMWTNMDGTMTEKDRLLRSSFVWVPFNPTAEEMARHLLLVVGPQLIEASLHAGIVRLCEVTVEETRKCSAVAMLQSNVLRYFENLKADGSYEKS